jgi:hypothetical protein
LKVPTGSIRRSVFGVKTRPESDYRIGLTDRHNCVNNRFFGGIVALDRLNLPIFAQDECIE